MGHHFVTRNQPLSIEPDMVFSCAIGRAGFAAGSDIHGTAKSKSSCGFAREFGIIPE
jgi:hypothetical protein